MLQLIHVREHRPPAISGCKAATSVTAGAVMMPSRSANKAPTRPKHQVSHQTFSQGEHDCSSCRRTCEATPLLSPMPDHGTIKQQQQATNSWLPDNAPMPVVLQTCWPSSRQPNTTCKPSTPAISSHSMLNVQRYNPRITSNLVHIKGTESNPVQKQKQKGKPLHGSALWGYKWPQLLV